MKKSTITVVLSIALFGLILASAPSSANATNNGQCKPVAAIFARGSGQELQKDEENTFFKQLAMRLGEDNIFTTELGAQEYGGHRYPAAGVTNLANGNAIGAVFSGGYSNDYGDSVIEGQRELFYRLVAIHSDCPSSRIVLAGYSQGAQVIGQSLSAIATQPDIERQIEFVALFGDPKLNLPEGRGFNPPACRKEQFSSWRREIGNCDTDNGSLGARNPYIPSSMENRVGLWCNDNDFVCGSSKVPWVTSGHGEYYLDNGPIDHAVLEVAERLQERAALQDVQLVPDMFKMPLGHPDVMLVLDNSTENMPTWSSFVMPTAFAIADQVTKQGGRVGLQTYNGCVKKGYTYNTPLNHNPAPLKEQVRSLWHFNAQCDLSQDLIKTLKQIKDATGWKNNRNKVIVVIPKVPFEASASAASVFLSHQPDFHLYSIKPGGADIGYNSLRVDSYKNTPIKLSDFNVMLAENTTNPQVVANLRNPNIKAQPGDVIEFSASNSLVYDDTIDHYAWDFDGNGETDQTTTKPSVTHVYNSPFSGEMGVTVVTTSNITDTARRQVLIQSESMFKHPAKAPVNLKLTKLSDSSIRLTWEPGDDSAIAWLVALDDFPLGYTKKDQHYADITDISSKELHTLSVKALVDEHTEGEVATITTETLSTPTENSGTVRKEEGNEISAFDKEAAEILGSKTHKSRDTSLNPAAVAISKLDPTTRSIIRGSLILLVITSVVVASVLGRLLYKHRKSLF